MVYKNWKNYQFISVPSTVGLNERDGQHIFKTRKFLLLMVTYFEKATMSVYFFVKNFNHLSEIFENLVTNLHLEVQYLKRENILV